VRRINGLVAVSVMMPLLALLATGSVAAAAPADQSSDTVSPTIIGGSDATETYPAMASLEHNHKGDPNLHTCAAVVVDHRSAVSNAHCATVYPSGVARTEQFHLRIGSNDRTQGGIVVGVSQILPHADWAWGAGGASVPSSDIVVLKLDRWVPVRPMTIPSRPHSQKVREIGWGVTSQDATSLPIMLQQLDTRLLPKEACAGGEITAGELCFDSPKGAGACYGDSGGPGLQRAGDRWVLIGGASRETTETCTGGPLIYTDITFYRSWIYQVIRTGVVPPATITTDKFTSGAVPDTGHWAMSM
jgi:secreted trypsin-like serine protease